MSESDFINAMMKVYRENGWSASSLYCIGVLKDFLNDEKVKFGEGDYDWQEDGARDLVETDMSYWGD